MKWGVELDLPYEPEFAEPEGAHEEDSLEAGCLLVDKFLLIRLNLQLPHVNGWRLKSCIHEVE